MGIMSMIARVAGTIENSTVIVEQAVGSASTALYIGNEYISAHAIEQAREAVVTACSTVGDPSKAVFISICKSEILALGQVPTTDVLRDYIAAHASECVQLSAGDVAEIKAKYGNSNARTTGLPVVEVLPAPKAKK